MFQIPPRALLSGSPVSTGWRVRLAQVNDLFSVFSHVALWNLNKSSSISFCCMFVEHRVTQRNGGASWLLYSVTVTDYFCSGRDPARKKRTSYMYTFSDHQRWGDEEGYNATFTALEHFLAFFWSVSSLVSARHRASRRVYRFDWDACMQKQCGWWLSEKKAWLPQLEGGFRRVTYLMMSVLLMKQLPQNSRFKFDFDNMCQHRRCSYQNGCCKHVEVTQQNCRSILNTRKREIESSTNMCRTTRAWPQNTVAICAGMPLASTAC